MDKNNSTKVVLVNPITGTQQLRYVYRRLLPPVPPMGLCYIAAILEKNNFEVHVIDQYAYRLNNEQLLDRINAMEPDVVGFSCLTPVFPNVKELCREIRLFEKSPKIILGNLHATLFSKEILQKDIADVIVKGEGEHTMLELLFAIRSCRDFLGIDGISYRSGRIIVHNKDREPIKCLDDLPYPAWHFLDWKYYAKAPMIGLKKPAVPMQASRGCPFKCVFCAQDRIHKGFRTRNIDSVIDEIEYIHRHYRISNFVFCDSFFPSTAEIGYEFCDKLMSRQLHNKIKWITEMRTNQVENSLLKKMKKAGLHLILFGFESGSQRILDSMQKRATIQAAEDSMRAAKRCGILTVGLFMIGMPDETIEDCRQTIHFAKQLDCDIVKFNIVIPYPGTPLYDQYKDNIDFKCSYKDFTSWGGWLSGSRKLPLVSKYMTQEELIKMQREGMFSYYIRFHFIIHHFKIRMITLGDIFFGGGFLLYRFFVSLVVFGQKMIRILMHYKKGIGMIYSNKS